SVRLEDIPDDHRQMVSHYTAYWRDHRETLLDGRLTARSPMANYPLVTARGSGKTIVAVYEDMVVRLDGGEDTGEVHLVNAKASSRIVLDGETTSGAWDVTVLDPLGRRVSSQQIHLDAAPVALNVPPSGLAVLTRTRD
ncbi:MAG: hypothetical protein HKN73_05350, partial [Gemmatimonadetes bacterium]|nr:hypothetical protein [Gemmatimonadota bacterium]